MTSKKKKKKKKKKVTSPQLCVRSADRGAGISRVYFNDVCAGEALFLAWARGWCVLFFFFICEFRLSWVSAPPVPVMVGLANRGRINDIYWSMCGGTVSRARF